MSNLIGKNLLNRYSVTEFIGRGGMAEVYKVWDSERAVHLAVKVLHADLAQDKVFLRRFKREAENLARLQHPHIVRFYGLERDGLLVFMLMDFVAGESLKTRIFSKDAPFTPAEAKRIIKPVAAALHYAHNSGLVHCDIKPANIMLDPSGNVRLADFGIARMSDAATATMVGAGTPAYMAPEQIRGEDPTPQSDIYALGIVLYEMLTGGERPFTGEQAHITGSTSEKVRWEQRNTPPPSPKQWNPSILPKVEAVILKSLEKDVSQRYETSLDFLNALELATGGEEERLQPELTTIKKTPAVSKPAPSNPTPQTDTKPDRSPRPVRFQSKWLPVAGITLAAILILGFGLLMGGGNTTEVSVLTNTPALISTVAPTSSPFLTDTPLLTSTVTFTPTFFPTNTPVAIYLSDFKPLKTIVGYMDFSVGKYDFTSPDTSDRIKKDDPIIVHGTQYPHGLYAHASSQVIYDLDKQYSELLVTIGLVDWIACGDGVVFAIKLDNKEIYRSKTMYSYSPPNSIKVDITNGNLLELIVEKRNDVNCDWAIWGDPMLR